MGAREDFMAVRHAALFLERRVEDLDIRQNACMLRVLKTASAKEIDFIRLYATPVYATIIDLAYAILGQDRPGGPAVPERAAEE